jgi:CP family cyanate transporter-like MFS transporter
VLGARRSAGSVGLGVAVVALSLNLRAAVASVGPVLTGIERGLRLSPTEAAVLTAIPVLCFGALAGLGPALSRRFGVRGALAVLLAAICAGQALRVAPSAVALFAGAAVAAAGIAGANVLLPALIGHDFPRRVGLMMGLYTTAVTGSASLAAGLTVPLGRALGAGWQPSIGVWAAPALLALLIWLPQLRGAPNYGLAAWRPDSRVWRSGLAWAVTVFFGLQSIVFYSVLEWLPSLYQSHGYTAAASGGLLSLSTAAQLPVALAVPTLATRARHQGGLALAACGFTFAGLLGILLAPTTAAPLWMVVLGVGQGASFPLSLTLVVLRTAGTGETTQLSAMAQSAGYLISAVGPALFGLLHATAGGWTLPLAMLLLLLVPQAATGYLAGAPRRIGG